jgi:hypothetical protein
MVCSLANSWANECNAVSGGRGEGRTESTLEKGGLVQQRKGVDGGDNKETPRAGAEEQRLWAVKPRSLAGPLILARVQPGEWRAIVWRQTQQRRLCAARSLLAQAWLGAVGL